MYGASLSKDRISVITDRAVAEMNEWTTRPLLPIYAAVFIDAIYVKVRVIIKNRGHFPNDVAARKLLWLAICDIEDKRAAQRAKERGKPRSTPRKAPGRLVEGQVVTNWKRALGQ